MNDKTENTTTEAEIAAQDALWADHGVAESKLNLVPLEEEKPSNQLTAPAKSFDQAIIQLATDPNADPEKLSQLMDLQERVLNREAEQAFYADFAAMQDKLPRVIKSKDGHNSKYAPLEDINDTIRPALQAHGFAITFDILTLEAGMVIKTILAHRLGHKQTLSIPLPLENSGNKNDVQAVGSTISYGKRYGVGAILNISTGDDTDGTKNQDPKETEQKTITEKQVKELEKLIAKSSTTAESLCEQAGISELSELRKKHFGVAKDHIRDCTEAAQ